jgi:hypothetical protein
MFSEAYAQYQLQPLKKEVLLIERQLKMTGKWVVSVTIPGQRMRQTRQEVVSLLKQKCGLSGSGRFGKRTSLARSAKQTEQFTFTTQHNIARG